MEWMERFLSKYDNESTKANYRGSLKKFLDCVFELFEGAEKGQELRYERGNTNYEQYMEDYMGNLKSLYEEAMEKEEEKYYAIKEAKKRIKEKVIRDLRRFVDYLYSSEGFSPQTVEQYCGRVKRFFEETLYSADFFVESFSLEEEWKNLRRRKEAFKKEEKTKDKIPTYDQAREILKNCDTLGRALFLTLLSSGMRIGEALQIKEEDIEFLDGIGKVTVKPDYAKNKKGRITFISSEAREELEKWLRQKEHRKKRNGEPYSESDRIFPITQRTTRQRWNGALEKIGLDEKDESTGRRKLHIHSLRKFFRSKLVNSKHIDRDTVEKLMGHKGYLTDNYVRISEEELAERYRKAQRYVTVFERGVKWEDVKELRETAKEQERKIKALKKRLDKRNGRIKELERKVEMLKSAEEKTAPALTDLLTALKENPDMLKELRDMMEKSEGEN